MSSFSSELGVQFGTCLEAPHVIDVELQLWAAIISSGPGNYPLNASYRMADEYVFQDSLGTSLEEICKIVPGGCLVFFPSYKLMEKLCSRWHETGQWSRLNAQKSLFVEPRGSQEDFDSVLKGYCDSIRHGNKPVIGRNKRGKKLGLNNRNAMECTENIKKGAAFIAVCRGKVSEGIDFSDEHARVVVIVGIPFPNINDIQVAHKKKFNDTYKSSKNLLSGSEWYCHQAFRALNQAAGRCIRHRFDYGAIIFIDERFREERNIKYISKWLRKSIRQYDDFDKSLEGLKSFFCNFKEPVCKTVNVSHTSNVNVEYLGSMDQSEVFTEKRNQKKNLSNGQNLLSNGILVSTNTKDSNGRREYFDLECDIEKDLRCSWAASMPLSPEDPELSVVKETPGVDGSVSVATPESVSKAEFSSSTIIHDSTESIGHLLSRPLPLSNSTSVSKSMHSFVTPERNVAANTNSLIPETESSLSLSVNSHTQKRRKYFGSSIFNHPQAEQVDTPDYKTSGHISFMASTMTTTDANCRTECGCETNCSENIFKSSNVPQSLTMDNCDTLFMTNDHVIDKRLQIFCSLCRNPLGLHENNLYVTCSITSLSKIHLATLWKGKSEPLAMDTSTSIPVVVSDILSIDKRLFNRTLEGAPGQGIWCKEDGCVFNTIFCPFCCNPNYCLGVQVMAADASNVQLLNKVLFYFDRLEIKNLEVSQHKDLSPSSGSCIGKSEVLSSIEKFSYSPQEQNLGGWRTTRLKMRQPKRGLLSTAKD